MLLPVDAFSFRLSDGQIAPRWLGPRDEAFVASVLATCARFDGLSVGDAEIAAESALPNRIAEGLWLLERRRWTTDIDAPASPEAIRAIVFESAAASPQPEALAEAAVALGLPAEMLLPSLFADRPSRRRLRAAPEPSSVVDAIARYNLAVVQTLLARAMELDAVVAGDPRSIALAAKRDGLLVSVEPTRADAVHITLAGALALFHDTAKYGRSIARFVPALVASPSWSLRARVVVAGFSADLSLADSDSVSFAGTIATAASDPVVRRLAKALRRGGAHVDLTPPVLRADERLVVADLAVHWGDGRWVYLDVMPFATPHQLAAKLELLGALGALGVPMLLCVDERYAGGARSPAIVGYRRSVDAWRVVAAGRAALKDDAA